MLTRAISKGWKIIVSNSSAAVSDIDTSTSEGAQVSDRSIAICSKLVTIESINFSEQEADAFRSAFNIDQDIASTVYYNPLYLSFYACGDEKKATKLIEQLRIRFCSEITEWMNDYTYLKQISASILLLKKSFEELVLKRIQKLCVDVKCQLHDGSLESRQISSEPDVIISPAIRARRERGQHPFEAVDHGANDEVFLCCWPCAVCPLPHPVPAGNALPEC